MDNRELVLFLNIGIIFFLILIPSFIIIFVYRIIKVEKDISKNMLKLYKQNFLNPTSLTFVGIPIDKLDFEELEIKESNINIENKENIIDKLDFEELEIKESNINIENKENIIDKLIDKLNFDIKRERMAFVS